MPSRTIAEAPGTGACIRINDTRQGIEIAFPRKPDAPTIEAAKRAGFRWSEKARTWYRKHSPKAEAAAYDILRIPRPAALTATLHALADEAPGLR